MTRSISTSSITFGFASMVAMFVSCATPEMGPASESTQTQNHTSVSIPGFELLGSPEARSKADILARFGPPASEDKLQSGRYSLMAYPVRGWDEKLLILFVGEDLLGFSRESSRAMLDSTLQHHAKTADGSIVVFQSWVDGRTSYFRARPEQLERAPKQTRGSPPPLSETKALELAGQWLNQNDPGATAQPTIQGIHEIPRLPGTAFYVVGIFDFKAKKMNQIVVLMDGTIITGKTD